MALAVFVGAEGMVGFMPVVAVSAGEVALSPEVQLAKAAAAAAVAVSLMKLRREMGGWSCMCILQGGT